MAEEEEKQPGGFLPPQPGGPSGPQSPRMPEPQAPAPSAGPPPPPPSAPGGGWQQPPPGRGAPPPPPGQPLPPGQPQAYGQQPYGQQPVYAPPPRDPNDPGNTPAIVSLVLSVVSIGLLFVSAGFSSILSLGLGIAGIVLGIKARGRVRDGVTSQHKDLGTAGFAIGIGATVLAAIATVFWGVVIGLAASDDSYDSGSTDNYFDTVLPLGLAGRVGTAAGHTLATLLA